ncbi:MAG: hypothetical protein LUH22_18480 [Bacteroides sp.]|nr:hypothetical protein [Bacteroides sp.]
MKLRIIDRCKSIVSQQSEGFECEPTVDEVKPGIRNIPTQHNFEGVEPYSGFGKGSLSVTTGYT